MGRNWFQRFGFILFVVMIVTQAIGAAERKLQAEKPALPAVESGIGSVTAGSYLLAVDRRSSVAVLFDTTAHAVHVFDRRGREREVQPLEASPTFRWGYPFAFAVADGGDRLALAFSGMIAFFEGSKLDQTVSLDKPPSLATDLCFGRGSDLLFSRVVPADPAFFNFDGTLSVLANVDDEGFIGNVALPIQPEGKESYLRASTRRQVRVAVDDDGAIWVGNKQVYRIRKLSPSGRVLLDIQKPDEARPIEDDPDSDPFADHGTDLAQGEDQPKGVSESIVAKPVIRDLEAAGGYLWLLVNDDSAPGGERLDIVLPGAELNRFSLPLPRSMTHMASLGVTKRFVILCPAEEGRPVTLDRDELERLAEKKLLADGEKSSESIADEPADRAARALS